ncbi:uncharacterized protein LOC119557013 [Drosophila subpulchrella]|uniref:uncharacterized protein LOC119557013 n=1 Tax=Drosophila subpulchrella TaxID=1486046 RepID=UPI0018A14B26|nr:uncharacterized protein LOC119557013 [Drosophila subpulchrella]
MSKYFNTEILKMLVAQAPADEHDISNDRFAAMETAGQCLMFVSSDPKKELHPRIVKVTLRQLFQKEAKEHGCIVKIREEMAQKDQGQVNKHQKFPRDEEYDEDSAMKNSKRLERARGGLNITFDPKMLFSNDSWTRCPDQGHGKLKILHRNLKPIYSSQTSEDSGGSVYVSLDEYIKMKDKNRTLLKSHEKIQMDDRMKSEKDPQEVRQQATEVTLQSLLRQTFQLCSIHMNNLTEFLKEFMDQPHMDNLSHFTREFLGLPQRLENEDGLNLDSDDEGVDWLNQNPFTSAHRFRVADQPEDSPEDSPSRLKRFRAILRSCLNSIGEFFSTWDQETFRSWLNREDPLLLGHSSDHSFLLLVDRLMLAVKWAIKMEELQAATRGQPGQMGLEPAAFALETERDQQLRNEPNYRRISSRSLTRLMTLLNSVDAHNAQPLYLVTQRKGRQC